MRRTGARTAACRAAALRRLELSGCFCAHGAGIRDGPAIDSGTRALSPSGVPAHLVVTLELAPERDLRALPSPRFAHGRLDSGPRLRDELVKALAVPVTHRRS